MHPLALTLPVPPLQPSSTSAIVTLTRGGFLGRHLVSALTRRGDFVLVIEVGESSGCDGKDGCISSVYEGNDRVVCVHADLMDQHALLSAFRGIPTISPLSAAAATTVYHTACLTKPWGSYREFFSLNVTGTENVIAAMEAVGISHLVYTSTPTVVIGGEDIKSGDETLPYPSKHLDYFSATKALAEKVVLAANERGVVRSVILRPNAVFGPGDTQLLPQLLARGKRGEITHSVGDGTNLVDFTFIDNAIHAHLLASDRLRGMTTPRRGVRTCSAISPRLMTESTEDPSPAVGSLAHDVSGEIYFISNGDPRPFWGFLKTILDGMGYPSPQNNISQGVAYGTAVLMEWTCSVTGWFSTALTPKLTRQMVYLMSRHHYFSISKAVRELGYAPLVSMDEAIQITLKFYRGIDGGGRVETYIPRIVPSPVPDSSKSAESSIGTSAWSDSIAAYDRRLSENLVEPKPRLTNEQPSSENARPRVQNLSKQLSSNGLVGPSTVGSPSGNIPRKCSPAPSSIVNNSRFLYDTDGGSFRKGQIEEFDFPPPILSHLRESNV